MAGSTAKRLTSLATLTKREARSNLGGDVVNKLANHLDVVTRHDHLVSSVRGTLWPVKTSSDISCTDEELRAVVRHERRVTATLILSQDLRGASAASAKSNAGKTYVNLSNELGHRLDGADSGDDHSALELLTLDTAKESTQVITGLSLDKLLVEHLNAGDGRLEVGAETDNLALLALLRNTALNTTRRNSATARDREGVLNGQEERLVEIT